MPRALLTEAKANKKDEFYTQLIDIESELKHYEPHFAAKVVYCNCDDPRISNFFKYFSVNFKKLSLKKILGAEYCRNHCAKLQSKHEKEALKGTPKFSISLINNGINCA